MGGVAVANHTKGLRSAEKVATLDKVNIFTHTRTHSRFDCLSLHTSAIQTQLWGGGVGWGGLQLPTIQRDSEVLKKLPSWTRSTSLHTHARRVLFRSKRRSSSSSSSSSSSGSSSSGMHY